MSSFPGRPNGFGFSMQFGTISWIDYRANPDRFGFDTGMSVSAIGMTTSSAAQRVKNADKAQTIALCPKANFQHGRDDNQERQRTHFEKERFAVAGSLYLSSQPCFTALFHPQPQSLIKVQTQRESQIQGVLVKFHSCNLFDRSNRKIQTKTFAMEKTTKRKPCVENVRFILSPRRRAYNYAPSLPHVDA